MMSETYLISGLKLLEVKRSDCWPLDSRSAHGVEDSEVTYIGSQILDSGKTYDYFEDTSKRFWYRTRWRLQNGTFVSEEKYLFGAGRTKRKRHQP